MMLDKTLCENHDCKNKCGRYLTEELKLEHKKNQHPISADKGESCTTNQHQ